MENAGPVGPDELGAFMAAYRRAAAEAAVVAMREAVCRRRNWLRLASTLNHSWISVEAIAAEAIPAIAATPASGEPMARHSAIGRNIAATTAATACSLATVTWRGVIGAKNITADQIAFWENVFKRIATSEEFRSYAEKNQWEITYRNADESRKFMAAQYDELKPVMAELGFSRKP